jgi:hypothetical protein
LCHFCSAWSCNLFHKTPLQRTAWYLSHICHHSIRSEYSGFDWTVLHDPWSCSVYNHGYKS